MDGTFALTPAPHLADLTGAAARIADIQLPDGAIPWFENGPWDAWNHTECAMALTAMGDIDRAAAAYDFLRQSQRPDGAWMGEYGNALPMRDRIYISREKAPAFLDSNFCAYPAVGVLHFLYATEDKERVRGWWPMIRDAIDFVLTLQRPDGTISWSKEAVGTDEDKALRAGNASIAKSLSCAIILADRLGEPSADWHAAWSRLAQALQEGSGAFAAYEGQARFAMDWYYPVLSGTLDQAAGRACLEAQWQEFVVDGLGCRCVSDEPWMTVAETAELALALIAIGDLERAETLLATVNAQRDPDGRYWMGWQYQEAITWPREQPSWTQAAVILASDALAGTAPSSRLLVKSGLKSPQQA